MHTHTHTNLSMRVCVIKKMCSQIYYKLNKYIFINKRKHSIMLLLDSSTHLLNFEVKLQNFLSIFKLSTVKVYTKSRKIKYIFQLHSF